MSFWPNSWDEVAIVASLLHPTETSQFDLEYLLDPVLGCEGQCLMGMSLQLILRLLLDIGVGPHHKILLFSYTSDPFLIGRDQLVLLRIAFDLGLNGARNLKLLTSLHPQLMTSLCVNNHEVGHPMQKFVNAAEVLAIRNSSGHLSPYLDNLRKVRGSELFL